MTREWKAFVLLCGTFFMIILDFSIVTVALPQMQAGLHFHDGDAQWVISGYSIIFAGCLMLAGRLADLLGRRKLFIIGLAIFTIAAFLGGFAQDPFFLILMRCVQGLGAAMVNPAALALVTAAFPAGPQRNRALGLWGVIGSSGVMAGMLLGGVLTSTLGWRSVLFVNVPIGILILLLTPALVNKDVADPNPRRIDYPGAILLTSSLLLFVYTLVRGQENGWLSIATVAGMVIAVALLAFFVFVESRSAFALIPLSLFRVRNVAASSALCVFQVASYCSMFVYASIYFQDGLHWAPWKAGLAFLPMTFVISAIAGPYSAPLANRFGARKIAYAATAIMIAGSAIMAFVPQGQPYWIAILPGSLVAGFGCMLAYQMSMILGLEAVPEDQDGVASALLSTMIQIGMSFGVALPAIFGGNEHDAFLISLGFAVLTFASAFLLRGTAGSHAQLASHIPLGKIMHRVR